MKRVQITEQRHRRMGILVKTALLSWLITLITMGVFVAGILPGQKQTFLENLQSKARGVSVSLQDVAAGAVVTEDYSEVVDHCMQVLSGDETIEFLVLTRNDGFALVNTRSGWASEQLDKEWRPDSRNESGGIEHEQLVDREVFKYSRPFDYSGIEWGWIHVGLSLDSYIANVDSSYSRTAWLAAFCILIGLAASVIYAKRLVSPIISLRETAEQVAKGDMDARAQVHSGDEVEALAHTFNTMTQSVQDREARVRAQNHQLASLVTDKALHAGDIFVSSNRITEASAITLGIQRVGVWLLKDDNSGVECLDLFDRESSAHSQGEELDREGHEVYFQALDKSRTLTADNALTDSRMSSLVDDYLQPLKIASMMDAPIRVGGRVAGVICHEHTGSPRHWTLEEENFAGSTADLLALALEARDRRAAQDELVAAKEAAEAASDAKSQFLANMSHEIRTPINGVMGMLQLLENDDLNDRQKRHVCTALSSADTLLSVIGDVLDFSKIEAGHFELDNVDFELRDAIDRGIRLFAGKVQSNYVELSYAVEAALPNRMVGDPNRLRQVLINLVGNAVKFTESGEIHVDCRLAERSDTHVLVQFSVRDTGPGIPAEQLETIFESFAQGDASMRRRHGGTGLGLAIARHLVTLMDGSITAESTVGKGSTIEFTVRLALQNGGIDEPASSFTSTHGLRVLVVDDSPCARSVACDYAKSWGCDVADAANASDAMEKLKSGATAEKPYKVVVIDANMPGIDGRRLAGLIGNLNDLEPLGLVLLSGQDMPSKDEIKADGFRAVVSKPVRASDLYDAIITAANGGAVSPNSPKNTEQDVPVTAAPGARILVVEDNAINRQVVSEMLLRMGHTCECRTTGGDALDAISSRRHDLVLMDCQMPGMDGYEATGRIRLWERQNRPGIHTPVIALTAHAMKGDRDRCLEAGMDDYLSKPLQSVELAAMLDKWLAGCTRYTLSEANADNPGPADDPAEQEQEAAVLARCCGNRELATKLLRDFVVQTKEDLTTIGAAIDAGDSEQLANAAHRLKGASGNLAIHAAASAAAELEKLGRDGRTEGTEEHVRALHAEAERVTAMSLFAEGRDTTDE